MEQKNEKIDTDTAAPRDQPQVVQNNQQVYLNCTVHQRNDFSRLSDETVENISKCTKELAELKAIYDSAWQPANVSALDREAVRTAVNGSKQQLKSNALRTVHNDYAAIMKWVRCA